ncbi:hypothetical protein [Salegentibacter chungangensis]|uniref:Uncharacterized protein n=1 Tax=Salegentibacter chungangensis TaxID=1335724 RepID=A0ABW3NT51_9FLAO
MRPLETIIQNFGAAKEGGLTHRKAFLNTKKTDSRSSWYNHRQYA